MPIGQYVITRVEAGLTHAQAVVLATDLGGTLAAPTTLAENNLILGFLAEDDLLWTGSPGNAQRFGPWLGLTQSPGSAEPTGGWTWDSGEAYAFTAWHAGQPDNFVGDGFAVYWLSAGTIGWGDHINDPVSASFPAIISAAVELAANVKALTGTSGHDFIWGGAVANVIRSQGGDDILQGNGGKDKLSGGAGNDSLEGGSGNDTLTGGSGADRLTGDDGADRFVFLATGDSRAATADTITDFSGAEGDKIDLSSIDALPGGAMDHLVWVGTAAFSGRGQVHVVTSGGDTWLEANLTGNRNPEFLVVITGLLPFLEQDVLL